MSQLNRAPGSISLPESGRIGLALLADGPFHEQCRRRRQPRAVLAVLPRPDVRRFVLREAGERVMGDLAALHRARADFDRAHPARLR